MPPERVKQKHVRNALKLLIRRELQVTSEVRDNPRVRPLARRDQRKCSPGFSGSDRSRRSRQSSSRASCHPWFRTRFDYQGSRATPPWALRSAASYDERLFSDQAFSGRFPALAKRVRA